MTDGLIESYVLAIRDNAVMDGLTLANEKEPCELHALEKIDAMLAELEPTIGRKTALALSASVHDYAAAVQTNTIRSVILWLRGLLLGRIGVVDEYGRHKP